tara:strand:- start:945 stop:1127 length:183 start_codon:yes stop_codon:yes gene_type:complete
VRILRQSGKDVKVAVGMVIAPGAATEKPDFNCAKLSLKEFYQPNEIQVLLAECATLGNLF